MITSRRKPPDVLRPAQFGARIQKRRRAGRNGLAEAVRQIGARGELPDQGCEKTVACANRAERRDREWLCAQYLVMRDQHCAEMTHRQGNDGDPLVPDDGLGGFLPLAAHRTVRCRRTRAFPAGLA